MVDLHLHPPIKRIIAPLSTAPFPIRLVGGAVRDAILGRYFTDYDFAAKCDFATLEGFIAQSPCQIVHRHDQHGSLLCTLDSVPFDITILRADTRTDGRHAEITATASWRMDAQRRDFTINALYCDFTGQIHDPLQQGIHDIEQRKLHFIGDAATRITEDYLRILRFFRFQAQLGFAANLQDMETIQQNTAGLAQLSRERVRQELIKTLDHPCTDILHNMQRLGIFPQIFGEKHLKIGNLEKITKADWSLRLAALFLGQQNAVDQLVQELVLSRKEARLLRQRLTPPSLPCRPHLWLYRYGRALSLDYWHLYGDNPSNQALFKQLQTDTIPIFPLSGADFLRLGLSGEAVGQAWKQAEQHWLSSKCQLTADQLLKLL